MTARYRSPTTTRTRTHPMTMNWMLRSTRWKKTVTTPTSLSRPTTMRMSRNWNMRRRSNLPRTPIARTTRCSQRTRSRQRKTNSSPTKMTTWKQQTKCRWNKTQNSARTTTTNPICGYSKSQTTTRSPGWKRRTIAQTTNSSGLNFRRHPRYTPRSATCLGPSLSTGGIRQRGCRPLPTCRRRHRRCK